MVATRTLTQDRPQHPTFPRPPLQQDAVFIRPRVMGGWS